jgi:signal transduction histidine kinase
MADSRDSHDDANQRLIEQSIEIARMAGSLAHEIKNPLSVIRMNMDLLAEDLADNDTPQGRRALAKVNVVQAQCLRLQGLLDDFLGFARAQKLELKPSNVNEHVSEVVDFVEPQMRAGGIEVVRHLAPDLPTVLLDRHKFHTALLNLLINSQQAMPDGGKLWVRTRETPGSVAIDLIDTGCGMDDKTIMHIFDAFYTTKKGGSGLGLPTTRRIIEGHNGTISVQSQRDLGTKFTLEFPVPRRIAGDAPR